MLLVVMLDARIVSRRWQSPVVWCRSVHVTRTPVQCKYWRQVLWHRAKLTDLYTAISKPGVLRAVSSSVYGNFWHFWVQQISINRIGSTTKNKCPRYISPWNVLPWSTRTYISWVNGLSKHVPDTKYCVHKTSQLHHA
jgi:hypothetical protein